MTVTFLDSGLPEIRRGAFALDGAGQPSGRRSEQFAAVRGAILEAWFGAAEGLLKERLLQQDDVPLGAITRDTLASDIVTIGWPVLSRRPELIDPSLLSAAGRFAAIHIFQLRSERSGAAEALIGPKAEMNAAGDEAEQQWDAFFRTRAAERGTDGVPAIPLAALGLRRGSALLWQMAALLRHYLISFLDVQPDRADRLIAPQVPALLESWPAEDAGREAAFALTEALATTDLQQGLARALALADPTLLIAMIARETALPFAIVAEALLEGTPRTAMALFRSVNVAPSDMLSWMMRRDGHAASDSGEARAWRNAYVELSIDAVAGSIGRLRAAGGYARTIAGLREAGVRSA